jgi:hypothetical protein
MYCNSGEVAGRRLPVLLVSTEVSPPSTDLGVSPRALALVIGFSLYRRPITFSRDCQARLVRLKVVSINRSLLKVEAQRLSAGFVHALSSVRPFRFQRHLMQGFRWDTVIKFLITVHTSVSALLFLTHTDISNSANTSFGKQF